VSTYADEVRKALQKKTTERGYIARSKKSDWRTPENVLVPVRKLFGKIGLDPCGHRHSLVKARRQYLLSKGEDGLKLPWYGKVFVNPPFDDVASWLKKASEECVYPRPRKHVVFLMPARTDTKSWHAYANTANAICLWKGRMKFVGAKASAPFPTAMLYWGQQTSRFEKVFAPYGMIFRPSHVLPTVVALNGLLKEVYSKRVIDRLITKRNKWA
jgi:hypothetical protein